MKRKDSFQRFKLFFNRLSEYELRRLDSRDLSIEDVTTSLKGGSLYFLGFYSRAGIDLAFKKYGFYEELEKRGFRDFQLVLDTRDPFRQRLALYSETVDPERLLAEIVVRRQSIRLDAELAGPELAAREFEVLYVEWLCLQNPRAEFTGERPRLPGQAYPGLGLGWVAQTFLLLTCRRLRLPAILNVPEYFHNAHIYSKGFHYIDPVFEGRRRTLSRDLVGPMTLADASWAIDRGCVLENGEPFEWFVKRELYPLGAELRGYFESEWYSAAVAEAEAAVEYRIDTAKWDAFLRERDGG